VTGAHSRGHDHVPRLACDIELAMFAGSAINACTPATGELKHLGPGRHRGVAWGGHRQRAMRGAVLHGGL
jgi:hypothetical protein